LFQKGWTWPRSVVDKIMFQAVRQFRFRAKRGSAPAWFSTRSYPRRALKKLRWQVPFAQFANSYLKYAHPVHVKEIRSDRGHNRTRPFGANGSLWPVLFQCRNVFESHRLLPSE